MATSNPLDYQSIRNTIATYCVALDSKDFSLLREVFTDDVDTIYPFKGAIKGVQAVADAIQKRSVPHACRSIMSPLLTPLPSLTPITSQHALTTQTISIAADGKTASATTYFTGIHFGQGKWAGKEVTAWGKYVDSLLLVDGRGDGGVPGASGKWMISQREVVFMGRLGEEGVMDGE